MQKAEENPFSMLRKWYDFGKMLSVIPSLTVEALTMILEYINVLILSRKKLKLKNKKLSREQILTRPSLNSNMTESSLNGIGRVDATCI